jgi:hypothetical protein
VPVAYAETHPTAKVWIAAFRTGLQGVGWSGGRAVRIDTRWVGADPDRIRASAAEIAFLRAKDREPTLMDGPYAEPARSRSVRRLPLSRCRLIYLPERNGASISKRKRRPE